MNVHISKNADKIVNSKIKMLLRKKQDIWISSDCIFTVHRVFVSRQQFNQSPEGIFFVHVDEKQCCDLTHPLAVAHLLEEKTK